MRSEQVAWGFGLEGLKDGACKTYSNGRPSSSGKKFLLIPSQNLSYFDSCSLLLGEDPGSVGTQRITAERCRGAGTQRITTATDSRSLPVA